MYNILSFFLHTMDTIILWLISTANTGSLESAYQEFTYSWLAGVAAEIRQ